MRVNLRSASAVTIAVLAGAIAACGGGASPPDPEDVAWERVLPAAAEFGGDGDQAMLAIVAGGPGVVAVGSDSSGGDDDAAVWTSPDGIVWSRVIHDESVFGGPGEQVIRAVVAIPTGLVAMGFEEIDGGRDAAVWNSADGTTWQRVIDPALAGPGDQAIYGGTASDQGVIAVGSDTAFDDGVAAIWVSADGRSWERLDHQAGLGGPGEQAMLAITAGGPGYVAVGYDAPNGDRDGAAWTSVDGVTWDRVAHDETVFGGQDWQVINAATSMGRRVIAVGFDDSEAYSDAVVWILNPENDWRRLPHQDSIFGGPGDHEMHGITRGGSGLVAVGVHWGGDGDAAAWASVRGPVWVLTDDPDLGGSDDQKMTAVTAAGPGLVAVGYAFSMDGGDAAVWVSRLP